MKKYLFILLLLSACKATPPSEVISNTVINELQSHNQAISLLEKQTSPECKTDSFIANLNALKTQTESMVGQVKSISKSCKVEKSVLEQKITIRDIIIGVLMCIVGVFVFLFVRSGLKNG